MREWYDLISPGLEEHPSQDGYIDILEESPQEHRYDDAGDYEEYRYYRIRMDD